MSARFDLTAYAFALESLLPRGWAWRIYDGSNLARFIRAIATPFEASDSNANALITDAFPASAVSLLPEWEETLGLPDPCVASNNNTLAFRQSSVVSALVNIGGQNQQRYKDLAALYGYTITITQFAPSRFGQSFGRPFGGADWAFAWQVNATAYTINTMKFGQQFGDVFASFTNSPLSCAINRAAPAHTIVNFNYGAA